MPRPETEAELELARRRFLRGVLRAGLLVAPLFCALGWWTSRSFQLRETRFNDVHADPVGRVFCGTMPTADRPGRLYRLDPDGTLTKLLEGIGCSNGMGFTPDLKRMYYTDSAAREIYLFDYDQATGALANQRLFARIAEEDGLPDGMTVDAEGGIWICHWGGWRVTRFSPRGERERVIEIPAPFVTSCAFAGPALRDLYITTASAGMSAEDEARAPLAGSLFRATPSVTGLEEPVFRAML